MSLFDKKIPAALKRPLFGLDFPHPLGSAPGEDPTGKKFDGFRHCAFVEIGPLAPTEITPKDRTVADTDSGWKDTIRHIQRHPSHAILAFNIAPLTTHPDCESVTRDLLQTFTFLYDFADLFIIDTFRKNQDGVAPLQSAEYLSESMDALIDMRFCYDKYKPILIRVDNDIQQGGLAGLLDYMMYSGLDGIIAGHDSYPLDLVRRIGYFTGGRFPIVAAGEIYTPEQADELLAAGASLLQVEKKYRRSILNHLIGNTPSEH
jgi:dihydroorotate dehydrogenase